MNLNLSPTRMVTQIAKLAVSPLLRAGYRVEVEGVHHVPRHGPLVVAPNHLSFTDPLFLSIVLPRAITFISKAEYFSDWRTAWMFRGTGQIPLRRGDGFSANAALGDAVRLLSGDGTIGIFPEGTRSRDGRLQRGNSGPARLALATGAPILPVGLVGTDAVHYPGEALPHLFRTVTVRFGPPHAVEADERAANQRAVIRTATERLMRSIADLSGQEYLGKMRAGGVAAA